MTPTWEQRARGAGAQRAPWAWERRAALGPEEWALAFAVLERGVVVGVQDLLARQLGVRREVRTGSWLGRAHQGHGTGTRMRLAVLSWPSTTSVR